MTKRSSFNTAPSLFLFPKKQFANKKHCKKMVIKVFNVTLNQV